MRVSELIGGVNVKKIIGDISFDVRELYSDSRAVSSKGLFFALSGYNCRLA